MIIIRSYLYFLLLGFTVLTHASAIILLSPFLSEAKLSTMANNWGKLNLFLLKWICNLRYIIRGNEEIENLAKCIIVSNHQSTWETIALRGLLPSSQAWILKKELISYPFFGKALSKTGQIAIDRSAGKRALRSLLEGGMKAIENHKIVIIFPEGTRTHTGLIGKYQIGGVMLAKKANVDVIPIAHDAGKFWPKGFIIYPGVVTINIGEPISASSNDIKTTNKYIEQWTVEQLS
jgi:1-acyl-sn-glycerol-3-phosphate acyltransferase